MLSLDLPDQSGFRVLVDLVPIASRPHVAVVVLTDRTARGIHEIAMQNGAYACFVRQFTSGEDLERAILRAMAFVGQMPKEDRYQASHLVSKLRDFKNRRVMVSAVLFGVS